MLGRAYGLTIDSLKAVDIVLADGRAVHADAGEHPDLFWAVRGAGFAFGVVTAFEFGTAPVRKVGYAQFIYDASELSQLLLRWATRAEQAPRSVTSFLTLGSPWAGRLIAQAVTVVDSEDSEAILAGLEPFATAGPLLEQQVYLVPYSDVVAEHRTESYDGRGEPTSRSGLIDHVTPRLAETAARLIASGDSYFFQLRAMGGAISDVPASETAFAHRQANFQIVAMGANPPALDRHWEKIRDHLRGIYVSFETSQAAERIGGAFPPATLDRLRVIKDRYDPENLFRDNFDLGHR